MIVVDVGCMTHGADESVQKLVERFQPELLFGFDPHPELVEGVERVGDTVVVRRRAAAWTHGGAVGFHEDGLASGIDAEPPGVARRSILRPHRGDVECFVLAAFVRTLPRGTVLKLDCEGAEYPLLEQIAAVRADERLDRVLVEWHPPEKAHGLYDERPELRCSVEEWA